jgi:hypothetical protein
VGPGLVSHNDALWNCRCAAQGNYCETEQISGSPAGLPKSTKNHCQDSRILQFSAVDGFKEGMTGLPTDRQDQTGVMRALSVEKANPAESWIEVKKK